MNIYKTILSTVLLIVCSSLLFGQNAEFNQRQFLGKWVDISDKRFYLVFNDSTLTEYTSYSEPEVFTYKIVKNRLEKKSRQNRNFSTYDIIEVKERTMTLRHGETKTYRKELGALGKLFYSGELKKLKKSQPFLERAESIDKNKSIASNSESGNFNHGNGVYEKTTYFKDTIISKILITYSFTTEGKKIVYSYYFTDNKLFFYSAKVTVDSKEKKLKITQCYRTICFDDKELVDETYEADCNKKLTKVETKTIYDTASSELDKSLIPLRAIKNNGNKFPLENYQK